VSNDSWNACDCPGRLDCSEWFNAYRTSLRQELIDLALREPAYAVDRWITPYATYFREGRKDSPEVFRWALSVPDNQVP